MTDYTFIIGNGPSSRRWHGVRLTPSIGCNLGIKDFDLTHLVCVDRLAVHEVRQLPVKSKTTYWIKRSILETPPGWIEFDIPGIDSGSAAIKLASELYPNNPMIAIGFDGVLGLDNNNSYSYYFRPHPTPEHIRQKHRQTIIDLLPHVPPVQFVSYQQDKELETIKHDQAFKIAITQSRKVST